MSYVLGNIISRNQGTGRKYDYYSCRRSYQMLSNAMKYLLIILSALFLTGISYGTIAQGKTGKNNTTGSTGLTVSWTGGGSSTAGNTIRIYAFGDRGREEIGFVAAREVAGQRAAICEHCIAVAAEMLVQRARELKCKILQASAIAGIFKKEKE